jgi:methylmalonyl-CoA/ethylmalonyl-CoA epimerase
MEFTVFRLHHNGYMTGDLERTAAMLERRFGYVRESSVIHDTVQTAMVLFLRLPGDRAWLELVTPNGPQSKLSRALEKRGDGWHHVCFETTDIEDTSFLREQGMLQISRPVPASAFVGRRISWFMDGKGFLTELLEAGSGPLSLISLNK